MATKTDDPDLETETDEEEEEELEEEETLESLKAKLVASKRDSRKWETRSKKNYEELQKTRSTDQGKPDELKAAEQRGRDAAMRESAEERVHDAITSALDGKLDDEDIDELLDMLNVSKFITDDHKVDRDRVAAYVERVSPKRRTKTKEDPEEPATGAPGIPRARRTAAVPAGAAGTRIPAAKQDRGVATFNQRHGVKQATSSS